MARARISPGAAVVAIGALLAIASWPLDAYWTGLLTQAVIFGGAAVGLDILVGFAGMASLGHGAFFGLAGYGLALGTLRWGVNPWLAAGIGIVGSTLVALAFAPLAVRVRGLAFLTVMLAFGQVVWGLATRGGSATGGENGLPGVPRPSLGPWDLSGAEAFYLFTLLMAVAAIYAVVRFAGSAVGQSLIGVRDNETRMAALGYDVRRLRIIAFVVAATVGAVFGALSAAFNGFVGPGSLDWRLSAQLLLSVVVGGAGSLWGPFVAGAGLHMLETYFAGTTQRWPLVLGLLYIVTVVLLPGGIASLPRLWRQRRRSARPAATPRSRSASES
ncbi:MAG: hypothetical protein IT337_05280 [Thermomicrobiales bacterium]|nr:hypothetical protein [Thermomicrobiales bacterium]